MLAICASCSKEEPGGTATQAAAGQWLVNLDLVDANGEVVYTGAEFFGIGSFLSLTFNTQENVENKMYVSDLGNFWGYQVETILDPATLTFETADWVQNVSYDCKVKLHGKIMKQAATTPSGMPADSIVYYVNFDDDPYPATYGYDCYRISGFRYTGFVADE